MKLLILFFSSLLLLSNFDINEIRSMYKQSNGSKENTIILYNKLSTVKESDGNVLWAYKGASIAMKGRFEKGVKDKAEMFKNGISLVEYALSQDSLNIELRFIRLTIQQNSPKLLKYKTRLEEDKNFVLTGFSKITSKGLKEFIGDYILYSNNFTEEEKNVTSHP